MFSLNEKHSILNNGPMDFIPATHCKVEVVLCQGIIVMTENNSKDEMYRKVEDSFWNNLKKVILFEKS